MESTARPPTTPPAIAPALEEDEGADVEVGVADVALLDACVLDGTCPEGLLPGDDEPVACGVKGLESEVDPDGEAEDVGVVDAPVDPSRMPAAGE